MSEFKEAEAFKDMLIESTKVFVHPHIEGVFDVFKNQYKPQNEWISVDAEGAPQDMTTVDILINSQRRIVDCLFIGGIFYIDKGDGKSTAIKNNVTHWMIAPALPTPPQ